MNCKFEFSYTDEELEHIRLAYKESKPWDAKCVNRVKRRIFEFHSKEQNQLCCYCYRDQHGEFKMVIDTEHILPKEKFSDWMFEIWNLSVSCKRCNMNIKGQKTDFLADPQFSSIRQDSPEAYFFIHPNLDKHAEHLTRKVAQVGSKRIVKYIVQSGSEKGRFAYNYFKLMNLEIDSFDEAQNPTNPNDVSDNLDFFRDIVKRLGG